MADPIFDEIRSLANADPAAAVGRLTDWLLDQREFHQAFEACLMAIRLRVGLPVIWTGKLEDLDESKRTAIEEGYLDACREIGGRLLDAGQPRDAWVYLRHLTDREATTERFKAFTPDEESREEYIEVAVHEGVAPACGFRQVLDHYGICNAITLFDGAMHNQPLPERQAVAAMLIADLHAQLKQNLLAEIQQQEGASPADCTIAELVADRDWLFGEHAYHIDTSHLNAVVRFAREATERDVLQQALDLCEYGMRLDRQFQYASEEPFADTYAAHRLFFRGLLATDDDGAHGKEACDFFRTQAESMPYAEYGSGPAEVYIALLARTGREAEALKAAEQLLPAGAMTSGFAPSLKELAAASASFEQLANIGLERKDIVTFASGLLSAVQHNDTRKP